MQIHELTQPKKSKLDEIEMFGPGGVADEIGSAWRNRKTLYGPKNFADLAIGLDPFTKYGKDARQRNRQAQADADQNELNRRASSAIAQGKQMGLDQKPTLDTAKERLKANQIAQKWISDTVAKWPEAAKRFNATPVSIDEARVSRRRGSTPGVINSKDLDPSKFGPDAQATLAAAGAPEFQPAPPPAGQDQTQKWRKYIKSWINQQLKVVSLEAIASAENNGLEGLAGITQTLKKNLDDMIAGDETAQQTALKNILVLATEANYLIDWERRVGRGQTLADPDPNDQEKQPTNTGLTSAQLQNLGAMAARSGDPAPKSTGSNYWDSLIQQAMAAVKR
jgi:hypothetical protein